MPFYKYITIALLVLFATMASFKLMDAHRDIYVVAPTETTVVMATPTPTPTMHIPEPRYDFMAAEVYILGQLLCGDKYIGGDGEFDFAYHLVHNKPYYEEMAKVLCVVMNRVRSPYFPNTVREVVLQEGQFTPMPKNLSTVPDDAVLTEIRKWCDGYMINDPKVQVVPENHLYFNSSGNNTNITRAEYR